jgi:hypothetical protein
MLLFKVPDRGSVNPSPLGERDLSCADANVQARKPHGLGCKYHLAWVRKYRYPILAGDRSHAQALVRAPRAGFRPPDPHGIPPGAQHRSGNPQLPGNLAQSSRLSLKPIRELSTRHTPFQLPQDQRCPPFRGWVIDSAQSAHKITATLRVHRIAYICRLSQVRALVPILPSLSPE